MWWNTQIIDIDRTMATEVTCRKNEPMKKKEIGLLHYGFDRFFITDLFGVRRTRQFVSNYDRTIQWAAQMNHAGGGSSSASNTYKTHTTVPNVDEAEMLRRNMKKKIDTNRLPSIYSFRSQFTIRGLPERTPFFHCGCKSETSKWISIRIK